MGGSIADSGRQMSSSTFLEKSELRSSLSRVESAYNEAREQYECAAREYEYYMSNSDSDDYSEYEASSLRYEMDRARERFNDVGQDLVEAQAIVSEMNFILNKICAQADAFASQAGIGRGKYSRYRSYNNGL